VSDIAASLVKELREATGAPMMDCKRALEETSGDLEAARKLLRERGMAEAGKRAGRETTEGIVLAAIGGSVGAMVAVGCETEPVARNEEFLGFAERALEVVEADGADAVAELDEERAELVGRIGENVVVRGAVRLEAVDTEALADYVHPPANKIGVLVKYRGGSPTAARQLAMHISFARPRYAARGQVPESDVEAEREILAKQPDVQNKPEQVRAKIVAGRLDKWYAEAVLEDQPWIHDTDKTVGAALADAGLEVLEFERFALAE
jgi:elongation factor Ts